MTFTVATTTGAGTVTIAANSNIVTGTGTNFTTANHLGKALYSGTQWGFVVAVASTTSLTLDRLFATSVTGGAWGYASPNSNITQSGTDTSLVGLASIPGVTVLTGGAAYASLITPKVTYNLNGCMLTVNGTLTANANKEELFFDASTLGKCLVVNSGGTFNGTSATDFGLTGLNAVLTYKPLLRSNRAVASGTTWNDYNNNYILRTESGGTANLTGVSIDVSLNIMYFGSGAITDCQFIGGANYFPLVTMANNAIVINGLYIFGTQGIVFNSQNKCSVSGLKVSSYNATSQHDSTTWASPSAVTSCATFTNYTSGGTAARDFGYWWNGPYKVINSGTGSKLICGSNTTAADSAGKTYGNGFTLVVRNVAFALANAGKAITSACVFARDTNNGSRRSISAAGFTNTTLLSTIPDYSVDRTYLWQSNASGVTPTVEVTTAIHTCNLVTLADPQLGKWDYRSITTDGTDKFNFSVKSYDHLLGNISSYPLAGINNLSIPWTLFDDTYTTLSETVAVAKLASSFTVNSSTNTITVRANSTFDDLYDAMKAWATRPVLTQLEYPSRTTWAVTASGTIANTSMNIVVNTGVTLSAGTKLTGLLTSGTLTSSGVISGNIEATTSVTLIEGARIGAGLLKSGYLLLPPSSMQSLTNTTITGDVFAGSDVPITLTFTNSTINTSITNLGAGLVSINLINSSVVGASGNVVAQQQATLTVQVAQPGSDIVIATTANPDGTGINVLATFDSITGTTATYNYIVGRNPFVNVHVYKTGYKDAHTLNYALGANSSTLPFSQLADKNYI